MSTPVTPTNTPRAGVTPAAVTDAIARLRRRSRRTLEHPAKRLNPVQKAARDRVLDRMASSYYLTEDAPCICGESTSIAVADLDRYGLPAPSVMCTRCGVVRTTPRFEAASLSRFYDEDYRPLYEGSESASDQFFAEQVQRGRGVWSFTQPHGPFARVADVGCGAGGLLMPYRESGSTVAGCDLGSDYLERGRSVGLDLRHGSFDTLQDVGPFDLVILSHVLEHIPDPGEFLVGLRSIVAEESGMVYVEVPGLRDIARYGDPLAYFQSAHLYAFDLGAITRLFESTGYQLVAGTEHVQAVFVASSAPGELRVDPSAVDGNLRAIASAERHRRRSQLARLKRHARTQKAIGPIAVQYRRVRGRAGRDRRLVQELRDYRRNRHQHHEVYQPDVNRAPDRKVVSSLAADGVAVIRDFLPPETIAQINQELRGAMEQLSDGTYTGSLRNVRLPDGGLFRMHDVEESLAPASQAFFDSAFIREVADSLCRDGMHSADRYAEFKVKVGGWTDSVDYHIDHWKLRFKAFLLLEDVTEAQAPFKYVVGSHSKARWRERWDWGYQHKEVDGSILPPEAVAKICRRYGYEERTFTGKAGDLILADTHGIHRGSLLESGTRLHLVQLFTMNGTGDYAN